MNNPIIINRKINPFKKTIKVTGDKSLSIRWVLFSSLASGISKADNLLLSEDVVAAIEAVKKLGIKVNFKDNKCLIHGKGISGYKYKKNITIDAKNSGTKQSNPIKYFEEKGSAQCKSSVIFAAMRTEGKTIIKAKKSRNHTELLCKYLKLPIKIRSKKNLDLIEVNKVKRITPLNYKIPSDISSGSFFIELASLVRNSELLIKDVSINPSRIGIITILRKMGVKIKFEKQKVYKGEKIANIRVKSPKILKSINCPPKFNAGAIDEFLVIFLVAAKAKGISFFKNLSELNQKESPRLEWGSKILNLMGIKTITTKDSIKIFGNPNLKVDKKIIIKDYLKDHRVFMTSVIAALAFGGKWNIHDKDSIKTSFPSFLKIIKDIKK